MMQKTTVTSIAAAVILGLTAQAAHAGGILMYEMGTEDVGLANAGSAARAQDASVVANNPAGMTRLKGDQVTVGAMMLYGDADYTMNDSARKDPGNVIGVMPSGSAFYSHSVSDDLKAGMALYGTFGLAEHWGESWTGHNLVTEVTLMGLTLQPSLAYRVNDKWSVGGGLGINYGIYSLKRDQLAIRGGGELDQDDTDVALNAKLGIFFEPSQQTRLGLTYTSKVDYEFDIEATGTLPRGRSWSLPVNLMLDQPQQVMFSAVRVLNDKWSILGEIGWQDWSTLSEAEVTVGNNISQSSSLSFQDTWHGALGFQYQLNTDTRLNFGVAYDSSMYDDVNNVSLVLPSGSTWRFGTGVQRQLNEHSSLGASFEYLMVEDLRVAAPSELSGSYDNMGMYFFAINYSYRF